MTTHAVIKVRSNINVNKDIRRTMELLRLNRVNHCIILHETDITRGMLQKIKDYVTWGEIKPEVLARMTLLKGKLEGGRSVDTAYIKANSEFGTPLDFAKAVIEGKTKYSDIKGIKPIIRLHPPIKGYEGIKRAYTVGGALGYRGDNINDLILRMLGPENVPTKAEPKAAPKKAEPAKAKPAPVAKKVAPKGDNEKPKSKPLPVKKPVAKKVAPKEDAEKPKSKPAPTKKPVAKKVAPKGDDEKPVSKPVKKKVAKKPVAKKAEDDKKGDA